MEKLLFYPKAFLSLHFVMMIMFSYANWVWHCCNKASNEVSILPDITKGSEHTEHGAAPFYANSHLSYSKEKQPQVQEVQVLLLYMTVDKIRTPWLQDK